MEVKIPLARPDIGPRERAAVAAVLRTPFLSLGPKVREFEAALAARLGAGHAIAVSSGTAALHLAVRALGLGPGDEVVTSPFSFVASANCILMEGARPVFADIDDATLNVDPAAMAAAVTRRTRALLPVDAFGLAYDARAVNRIARREGLAVIEDSCEALGATWHGRAAGTLADVGAFGFYPNKQITTGEGGMLVTRSARIAALARSMRNQGRDRASWLVHHRLGWNYRLDEMSAALGLAQLSRLDELLARRRRVAGWYAEALAGTTGVRLLDCPTGCERSWFVYVVRLAGARARAAVERTLAQAGIATARYFPPIHLARHFRALGWRHGQFPVAERASRECLALPFHGRMRAAEVERVAGTVQRALR